MKLMFLALLFTLSSAFGQQQINVLTTKDLTINGQYNVSSTTLASKPCPPMTQTQRDAISSPTAGMCVYNTTTNALNVYNGTLWGSVGGGGLNKWVTSHPYLLDEVVIQSNFIYQCLIPHTSGTFATDLASGDWVLLSPNVDLTSNQTIGGTKTFSNTIVGNISGNAATVTTIPTLSGEVTNTGNNVTLNNSAVIAKTLTGFTSAAGTIAATDTILQALQKADGNDALKQPKATLTSKGDLYVATASSTVARQGVGTNNQVLTADSAQTNGLKWADSAITTKSEQGSNIPTTKIIVPNNQLTETATGIPRLETNSNNLLVNPSFEHGTFFTGWSCSLGASSVETTLIQDGAQSAHVNSSGAGVRCFQSTTQNAANLKGLKGIARIYVNTTDTVMQACALVDGTTSGFDTGCITIPATSGSSPFYLAEIPFTMGGTSNGIVIKTATTTNQPTYLDNAFLGASGSLVSLTGEVTTVGSVATLTNSAVIGKVLTGYTSGAGTVAATDTILGAVQKLNGNDALKQPLATLTTKGDLYVATASSTVARQAVGTNGQVLTADSTQTNGVKYADPTLSTKEQSAGSSTSVTELQTKYSQLTTTATGKRLIEQDCGLLPNCGMEGLNTAGVANAWTNSAGTASITTTSSEIYGGLQAQKIVLSAQTLSFTSTAVSTNAGLNGTAGLIAVAVNFPPAITNGSICAVIDGTEQTCIPSTAIRNTGLYDLRKIPIVFGASSVQIKVKTTGAATGTVLIDEGSITLGLDTPKATIDTDWTAYTPTFDNMGTPTGVSFWWKRLGQDMVIRGTWQPSACTTTNIPRVYLPTGYIADTTKFGTAALVGSMTSDGTSSSGASSMVGVQVLTGTPTKLSFNNIGNGSVSNRLGVEATCTAIGSPTTVPVSMYASVPILGWASNASTYSTGTTDYNWTAYTPTTQGLGTPTSTSCFHKRKGADLFIDCKIVIGTPTAVEARIGLPSGLVIDPSIVTSVRVAGGTFASDQPSTPAIYMLPLMDASATYLNVGGKQTTQSNLNKANGNDYINAGNTISIKAGPIPIQGWTETGTIYGQFVGIEKCANDYECTSGYDGKISTSGVASNQNLPWISSASWGSTGNLTVVPTAGIFVNSVPNCTVTTDFNSASNSANVIFDTTNSTTSSLKFYTTVQTTAGSSAATTSTFGVTVHCEKGTNDFKPKTGKIASSIGVPTVPGITTTGAGNLIDTFSVSYGATIGTACASANGVACPYVDVIGANINVTHGAAAGAYNLVAPKTYAKLKCVMNAGILGLMSYNLFSCSSCSTLSFTTGQSTNGTDTNSYGTLMCQGTY